MESADLKRDHNKNEFADQWVNPILTADQRASTVFAIVTISLPLIADFILVAVACALGVAAMVTPSANLLR